MIVVIDERTFEFADTAIYARTSQEAMSRMSHTPLKKD